MWLGLERLAQEVHGACAETKANRGAEAWQRLLLERLGQEEHEAGAETKANRGAEAWVYLVLES